MADSEIERARSKVTGIAVGAFVAIVLSHLAFYAWFGLVQFRPLSGDPADWGTYGDFVGGIANPLVSLATLMIVARAYLAQRQELNETVKALKSSAREQDRMAEVSILQGQIQAKTALLNRWVALRTDLYGEMQRVASQIQKAGGEYLVMTAEGLWTQEPAEHLKELKERLNEIDSDIGAIQDSLSDLAVSLDGRARA